MFKHGLLMESVMLDTLQSHCTATDSAIHKNVCKQNSNTMNPSQRER